MCSLSLWWVFGVLNIDPQRTHYSEKAEIGRTPGEASANRFPEQIIKYWSAKVQPSACIKELAA